MELFLLLASILGLIGCGQAQQYIGDFINNSLPLVPDSEITFFRIPDPAGKNNNLTLINYYSHGTDGSRIVESKIQRAVIVIHGLDRDPGTYESNALSALYQVPDQNINFDTVAVMAPYFPNGDDKNIGYPWTAGLAAGQGSTTNALVWPGSQWSAGGNAQYPYASRNTISSYYVLDTLIKYFDNATLFPNMKQIVVAGHSLGAQTVHRYAAIGNQLSTRSPVTYWVANPNSYIWFNTTRPFDTSSCSVYDVYRDGFTNFTLYPMTYAATSLVAQGRTSILANYNSKGIAYARGLQDLGDDSSNCAPFTTGGNRNERFFNFIKTFPPSCSVPTSRTCDTVDFVNVGHDSGQMMASSAGQARLFLDNFYGNGSRAFDFGYPRIQAGDDPFPNPALNGTLATVNNNTYAGNMTYFGCYSDQSPTALAYLAYDNSSNTIEFCINTCISLNYTIAGVEYGSQCFCGNALTYQAQLVVESSCSFPCAGNSTEICGGFSRISIFSNGSPVQLGQPIDPETIGSYYFANCYTETATRALAAASYTSSSMTLESCSNFCSAYRYFGTEYGSECYCDNTIASAANVTATSDCSEPCSGNPLELCGAANRLSVYELPPGTNPSSSSNVASTTSTTAVLQSATSQSATLQSTAAQSTVSQFTASQSASQSTASQSASTPTTVSPGPAVCPQSNNTIITSNGINFLVECDYDHYGGDLSYLTVTSLQQCIDTCATTTSCIDVSLSGSTCYMKSSLGQGVVDTAVNGAKVISSTTSLTSSTGSTATLTLSTGLTTSVASSTGLTAGMTFSTGLTTSLTFSTGLTTTLASSTGFTTSVTLSTASSTSSVASSSSVALSSSSSSGSASSSSTLLPTSSTATPATSSAVLTSTSTTLISSTPSASSVTSSSLGILSSSSSVVTTTSSSTSLSASPTVSPTTSSAVSLTSTLTTLTSTSSATTSSSSPALALSSNSPALTTFSPISTSSLITSTVTTIPATTSVAPACPASNGTMVSSLNGTSWLIECGIDHYAGDLSLVYVASFQDCITACANNTGCVDVSLNGDACYMKSLVGTAISKSVVWGARLTTVVASSITTTSTHSSISGYAYSQKPVVAAEQS